MPTSLAQKAEIPPTAEIVSKVRIPITAVRGLLSSFLSSVQTKKVYALANDLELEKSMFIRKRVNFCMLGIVAWT